MAYSSPHTNSEIPALLRSMNVVLIDDSNFMRRLIRTARPTARARAQVRLIAGLPLRQLA